MECEANDLDVISPEAPSSLDEERFSKLASFEYYPYYNAFLRKTKRGELQTYFRLHDDKASSLTYIDGKEYINFSTFNYLDLNGDPRISDAAINAIRKYGTSVCASRLVSGERSVHRELETALAEFYQVDKSLTFVSGHATNVTTIGHLFGPKDIIFYDELVHNSIIKGIQLSGSRHLSFPHNDWQALDSLCAAHRRHFDRALIVLEGLYSMDGDFPDLPEFIQIKKKYFSFLMIDEAHSLGVLGKTGKGIREYFGVDSRDVDIWMGTLSKVLASSGGYIAGSAALIDQLRFAAPGFLFSVGLAPSQAASAHAALDIISHEPHRVEILQKRGQQLIQEAKSFGLDTGLSEGYNITSFICGRTENAVSVSLKLFQKNINALPIIFPAVSKDKARVRFFITSAHTPQQISYTVRQLAQAMER